MFIKVKVKVNVQNPITSLDKPLGSRRLRLPDFMTTAHEGGKVVSPTHRPHLPSGNIAGTHFCYKLSQTQGHRAAGRIMSMKNSNYNIGNRTRDLLACSAVPQPTEPPGVLSGRHICRDERGKCLLLN